MGEQLDEAMGEQLDEAVEVPGWLKPHLVREVTGDDAYSNEKLAL